MIVNPSRKSAKKGLPNMRKGTVVEYILYVVKKINYPVNIGVWII
jgi:hypothetical protein